jgi:hypothetical protein
MMTPTERKLRETFDYWEEHPQYSTEDWKQDVANGDTKAGYWTWVASQIDLED